MAVLFFFSSRRRHTRYWRDWSSDVCSSDLAPAATTPPSPAPPRPTCRLNLLRLHRRRAGERAIGEPAERDAEGSRHVAHGVEGAVIRHDLQHVARARGGQPHTRAHRDTEVAPVFHPGGGRTVDELGALAREQARRVWADRSEERRVG